MRPLQAALVLAVLLAAGSAMAQAPGGPNSADARLHVLDGLAAADGMKLGGQTPPPPAPPAAPAAAPSGAQGATAEEIVAPDDDQALFSPLPTTDGDINRKHLHFTKLPVGKRVVLFVWASIAPGDSERFEKALNEARPVEEIWLFSGGGSLEDGLEIGRIIRHAHLATRIKRNMQCISACNFIFMGGIARTIEPGGVFGVHMFSDNWPQRVIEDMDETEKDVAQHNKDHPDAPADVSKYKKLVARKDIMQSQQQSAQIASQIARFLVEMSLSLKFLTQFANIPNENWRALTRDELRDFNVVNTD